MPIGFKHSEESKKKMSEALTGRKRSPFSFEWRKNIGNAQKGKKKKSHTEETKLKISVSKKGKSSRGKGFHLSDEHKKKLSDWRTGKKFGPLSDEVKKKISEAHKGKKRSPFSEEWKHNMGNASRGKKRPPFSEQWLENMAKSQRGKIGRRGELSNFWHGGTTELRELIRTSSKYRWWRTTIFKRDNYTCQKCNLKGGVLQVDHHRKSFYHILKDNSIKSLDDAIKCEELWDFNNGKTLCIDCHKETDNYGWKFYNKNYANTAV